MPVTSDVFVRFRETIPVTVIQLAFNAQHSDPHCRFTRFDGKSAVTRFLLVVFVVLEQMPLTFSVTVRLEKTI